ncbi:hypothetical protein L1987_78171 [Smallanthus sonchifolius]|uniref:Uncharacterized protein n=1 Tax=Smallanthus sonchifolius TaxID=185202 RepID=A0ACB8ZB06_9ASTR|nr:hypothetical protein L1987_78171 [Smallanthus sonchifolius]
MALISFLVIAANSNIYFRQLSRLVVLYGCSQEGGDGPISGRGRAVLWNPSVRKVVDVVVPNVGNGIMYETVLGFGVCCESTDPKIVKITHINNGISCIPWQIEVFTLSTGAWRNPYRNLPCESIRFRYVRVAIDGFLYWLAMIRLTTSVWMMEDGVPESFTKLFTVQTPNASEATSVWMMEDGVPESFTKLFTVQTPNASVHGFRKSGEAIIVITKEDDRIISDGSFAVYDPYSKQINDLGITGFATSLVFPYMETLLLLDQPDFIIYDNGKRYIENFKVRSCE